MEGRIMAIILRYFRGNWNGLCRVHRSLTPCSLLCA